MNFNILIAGKGGEGVVLVSEIIAQSFIDWGFEVKTSEVHGMAQRGGSVVSHIRCGEKIYSPIIPFGEVDYLIAIDDNEGRRWQKMLHKKRGVMITLSKSEYLLIEDAKMKNIAILANFCIIFIVKNFLTFL